MKNLLFMGIITAFASSCVSFNSSDPAASMQQEAELQQNRITRFVLNSSRGSDATQVQYEISSAGGNIVYATANKISARYSLNNYLTCLGSLSQPLSEAFDDYVQGDSEGIALSLTDETDVALRRIMNHCSLSLELALRKAKVARLSKDVTMQQAELKDLQSEFLSMKDPAAILATKTEVTKLESSIAASLKTKEYFEPSVKSLEERVPRTRRSAQAVAASSGEAIIELLGGE